MGLLLMLAAAAGAPGVETIRYATGPCFGTCPVYSVTVSADGRGTFEGERFTAAKGKRRFRVSPAQYAEFRRRLQADRPVGEVMLNGPPLCTSMATDQISVDVRWHGGDREPAHLGAYFGCDRDRNARMFRALASAPAALPISRLVGSGREPR